MKKSKQPTMNGQTGGNSIMRSILSRIEDLVRQVVLELFTGSHEDSDVFEENVVRSIRKDPKSFAQIIKVCDRIYGALDEGECVTKRSVFYSGPHLFGKQRTIDKVLTQMCCWLKVPRWELGVKATDKIRIYGDLVVSGQKIQSENGDWHSKEVVLPDKRLEDLDVICGARFILVVEKDAVFQKILSENFYGTFKPCLLITAKGYPDLRTRCLLSLINKQHPLLPILGLFDADPHGLGVFCTYKYGTQNPTMKGADLRPVKISQMKLIGLLPTELMSFQLQKSELIALNKSDRALLYGIQKRWYFEGDPDLIAQTKALLDCGFKAEIEVLDHINPQFLCQEYLSMKLRSMGIFPLE